MGVGRLRGITAWGLQLQVAEVGGRPGSQEDLKVLGTGPEKGSRDEAPACGVGCQGRFGAKTESEVRGAGGSGSRQVCGLQRVGR